MKDFSCGNLPFEYELPQLVNGLVPGGVVVLEGFGGAPVYVSEGFFNMTGYIPAEPLNVLGEALSSVVHAEDYESFVVSLLSRGDPGELLDVELRLMKSDNSVVFTRCLARRFSSGTDELHFTVLLFVDISKQKEEAITALEELASLSENIPGGVAKIVLNENLQILLASDGFYELLGYTREEFHSEPVNGRGSAILFPGTLHSFKDSILAQLKKSGFASLEFRIIKKNRSVAWMSSRASIATEEGGYPVIVCVLIDTTLIKRTERQLVTLTNSFPGGIAHLRLLPNRFSIDYSSEGLSHLTGYSGIEYYKANSSNREAFIAIYEAMRRCVDENLGGFEVEFPFVCLNGCTRWLRSSGARSDDGGMGEPSFVTMFIDMTDIKKAKSRMELNEQRYRLIFEETQDVVFEWNIAENFVYYSPSFKKKFGYEVPDKCSYDYVLKNFIHQKDLPTVREANKKLCSGTPYAEFEYRIKNSAGEYIWCKNKSALVTDENNRPALVMGVISDIDKYIKNNEALSYRAQRDLLTGVYNKITAQEKIEEYLSGAGGSLSALFLLDIDDFKSVNDLYGHPTGDSLLYELAQKILQAAGNNSIVGRIGGDEFIILLKNPADTDDIRRCGEEICELFSTCPLKCADSKKPVHGSIGGAIYPNDGETFSELYRSADIALYRSKELGKNCFSLYQSELKSLELDVFAGKHDFIESSDMISGNLVEYVLNSLFGCRNLPDSINNALNLIRRYYSLGGAYVYENDIYSGLYIKTVDLSLRPECGMANAGMELFLDSGEYAPLCDSFGIFKASVSSLPEGWRKRFEAMDTGWILQVPILDEHVCRGFIGFYTNDSSSIETEDQNELVAIGKILGVFISRQIVKNISGSDHKFTTMLDNMDTCCYVVDNEYRIIYYNKAARKYYRTVISGEHCYFVIHGLKERCTGCPVSELYERQSFSRVVDGSLSTVSRIQWIDGTQKHLIMCGPYENG